jgi:subtilisin family serine protease
LWAQTEDAWVFFTDKPSEAVFLENPATMLSQRALDRRTRLEINLDGTDVPIEQSYINQIKNAAGVNILAKSKWLNALHVQGLEADLRNLANFTFVQKVEFANKNLASEEKSTVNSISSKVKNKLKVETNFNYGSAANQIQMLKGDVLHGYDFTGQGIYIALMDGGFPGVDIFAAFERIRLNNQILGGYNFVDRDSNIYSRSSHGTSVLSTIAGYVENQFVGTAPDASFYLFITEDVFNETPLEESLWVEAAEKADSLGVDIINTSLGYSEFDRADYNYTYNDMNGQSTFISRGAEIAFSRGMIVVNSAGNEGNSTWNYITAPADAPSVLTVGAVDSQGIIASFSSFGPTFDGRVKPDVLAQGLNTAIINSSGTISTSNGTSFSSPVLAGVIACFWQAFPNKKPIEIIQHIKESAHLYNAPTNQEGYGIPNFEVLYNTLYTDEFSDINLTIYPNPVQEKLFVYFPSSVSSIELVLYNVLGKQIFKAAVNSNNPYITISQLSNGLYFAKASYNNTVQNFKLIKN